MIVGSRVRFQPTESFMQDGYFPSPGSIGTVIKVPGAGSFGGCVTVRWFMGGAVSHFCGRNGESLVEVPR